MTGPPRRIAPEPLAREAFAPFGDVIEAGAAGRSANLGTALRHDWTSALRSTRPDARPNLAVFRSLPQPLPFRVTLLERHPHSTQVFAALAAARWLLVVAPADADGAPDVAGLRAFVAGPGQAINFRLATWHHPVIALDRPAELLMLAWEDGGAGDCETRALPAPVDVG